MKEFGTAVILAGGKSSRMGFDKQLLTVKEKMLSDLVCDSLSEIFDDIVVVTNKPSLYKDKLRTISDEYIGMGPLAGIHTALKHAKSKYVYMIACDMPIVCTDYIEHMMQKIRSIQPEICVTRKNNWIEPFNAFYCTGLTDSIELRLSQGNTSIFGLINSSDTLVIPENEAALFDNGLNMFTNLNTGTDYMDYLKSI